MISEVRDKVHATDRRFEMITAIIILFMASAVLFFRNPAAGFVLFVVGIGVLGHL